MLESLSVHPGAFIFDCDGTLLASMGMWLRAQVELLATFGVRTVAEDFARFESMSVMDECHAYHDTWGVGADGQEVYDRLMSMLMKHYEGDIRARFGVQAFLDEARRASIPMVIATSTPAVAVRAGLQANGLDGYFADIVTTGEAGASKDHPDVYDLALSRLCGKIGIEPLPHERVWVFEDAVFGLKSSGAAGYRRVGIFDPEGRCARDDVKANCEIFIDEFDELSLDMIRSFREGA